MSCIGIISAQYLPHMGGVERYTYNLAKKLVEKGDRVVVITSAADNLKRRETVEKIEIVRLSSYNLMNGRYPVIKPDGDFRKQERYLDNIPFDFVLINTRFYLLSLWGARYTKKRNIRCAIIEHGTSHLQLGGPIANTIGQIVEHTITLADKLYCKNYYGVSEACMEWSRHFHIRSKGTLYNAIDPDAMPLLESGDLDYSVMYGISASDVKIAFTGRLIPEKGIMQLVHAIRTLRLEGKKVVLFIAGNGPLEQAIKDEKIEGVFLLGRLENNDVIKLLYQTDIFCLPSVSEGFSTSILEAAACRNYIVTTKRGGSKELILDDTFGTIMDDNLEETVTATLRKCIASDKMRKQAVEKTYSYLCSHFTWEQTSEKVHLIASQNIGEI